MKINSELPIANKRVFSTPIQYSAVKQLATDYQKAKAQVTTALMTAGCGHWIEKPVEQDQFSLQRNPEIATPGCYIVIFQGCQSSRPRWYFEICSHYLPFFYFSTFFFLLNITYFWKYFTVETTFKSFPPTLKSVFTMLPKSSLKKSDIENKNTDFSTCNSPLLFSSNRSVLILMINRYIFTIKCGYLESEFFRQIAMIVLNSQTVRRIL